MKRSRVFLSYAVPSEPKERVKRVYAANTGQTKETFSETIIKVCQERYDLRDEGVINKVKKIIAMASRGNDGESILKQRNYLSLASALLVLVGTVSGDAYYNNIVNRGLIVQQPRLSEQQPDMRLSEGPSEKSYEILRDYNDTTLFIIKKLTTELSKDSTSRHIGEDQVAIIIHRELEFLISELEEGAMKQVSASYGYNY